MLSILSLTAAVAYAEPQQDLDFWLGDWKIAGRLRNGPKADWQPISGTNKILKIQSGKVIEENFVGGSFTGQSWSLYDPNRKMWVQTWVDNSGGYLLFEGGKQGDKFILSQTNVPKSAPNLRMRMVFHSFSASGFKWDWQRSDDKGKTWADMFQLTYSK